MCAGVGIPIVHQMSDAWLVCSDTERHSAKEPARPLSDENA